MTRGIRWEDETMRKLALNLKAAGYPSSITVKTQKDYDIARRGWKRRIAAEVGFSKATIQKVLG